MSNFKKTIVNIGPKDTEILGNCLYCIAKSSNEESKKEILKILKYITPRDNKKYSFFNIEEILLCWEVIKTCLDDKVILYSDDEKMQLGKIAMHFAEILDDPNGGNRKWREFT